MIEQMLLIGVQLELLDNVSYKLVSIKQSKVDQKLHTIVKLVDFISVILHNRRVQVTHGDISYKQIIFDHKFNVRFLEKHH